MKYIIIGVVGFVIYVFIKGQMETKKELEKDRLDSAKGQVYYVSIFGRLRGEWAFEGIYPKVELINVNDREIEFMDGLWANGNNVGYNAIAIDTKQIDSVYMVENRNDQLKILVSSKSGRKQQLYVIYMDRSVDRSVALLDLISKYNSDPKLLSSSEQKIYWSNNLYASIKFELYYSNNDYKIKKFYYALPKYALKDSHELREFNSSIDQEVYEYKTYLVNEKIMLSNKKKEVTLFLDKDHFNYYKKYNGETIEYIERCLAMIDKLKFVESSQFNLNANAQSYGLD